MSAWWFWPLFLFILTFLIGLVAPVSGIGGGSLYVPLVAALTPFSIDFVRGAGSVMAMVAALSSVPYLIKKGLANMRIYAVVAPIIIIMSTIGSIVGLWLSNALKHGACYVKLLLGIIILFVVFIMTTSKRVEFPEVKPEDVDSLSRKLNLMGAWYEPSLDKIVEYRVKNLPIGLGIFAVIGFIAGMFGLGAGWANVPVLNLIMGIPIKAAAATSMLIITAIAPAVGVYLSKGAVLPIIVVPSVVGMTIGARLGAKIAARARPVFIRWLVIGLLFLAGALNIVKGLQGLGVI